MFLQYMRDHRKLLFLLALLVIIFTVVFALYLLPYRIFCGTAADITS